MVHGVELPWKSLGAQRVGDLGRPVVVRVVIGVETVVDGQSVQLVSEPILERLEVAFPLPPLRAPIFEPNLR